MKMNPENRTTFTADEIIEYLETQRNDAQRDVLMRFFKTGPGQ